MRVFRNRAEAEAAGFTVFANIEAHKNLETAKAEFATVRTELEAQLAEALEAVMRHTREPCTQAGHDIAERARAALRAFRGE